MGQVASESIGGMAAPKLTVEESVCGLIEQVRYPASGNTSTGVELMEN